MKIKHQIGYAVLVECYESKPWKKKKPVYEFCFTWDKKHPDEGNQISQRVYAIYPTKAQAEADAKFRGLCIVKKITL